ncbi:hypothetical protein GTR02_21695, partial [Kineococcus sp. R8]|uniref:hypothetical protein n=1 Tax=Kineococcus siccus TaxID=2696567 RepID=UPI001411C186
MPPPPATELRAALLAAVERARAGDGTGVTEHVERLGRLDPDQVRLVTGALLRSLLEQRHPDGLDADDLRDAVARAARGAAPWCDDLDPQVLVGVLTAALGVHDASEGLPAAPPGTVVRHAVALLVVLGGGPGGG